MENVDISGRAKNWIRFGLIIPLAIAAGLGYGAFEQRYHEENLQIKNARVEGTMLAVRTLVDGKVNEVVFEDGAEVRAGDVIARLEVSVTEEAIRQMENTVKLAKQNLEDLKLGQIVQVPVKTVRTIQTAPQVIEYGSYGRSASELASLEERANRMDALFEMGAISRVQRDAARAAYESALAESYTPPPTYLEPESIVVEEIEYVEQWQPTPPEALLNAENAIKQAELSLNVALQESQENEIIAPVSGTIYYVTEMDGDLNAGNVVARIGDSKELWLSAEVSESTFNRVKLGSLVSYSIAGRNLTGTVTEKIAPAPPPEPVEVPAEETAAPADTAETPAEENPAEAEPVAQDAETPAETEVPAENPNAEGTDDRSNAPDSDKYIVKFSLPVERDFDCKPNDTTTVTVRIF
ncbi:MAG: biotin/lipoyl-binding protein [Selenomonadaceae bacterium]|nr:biotin/lipoyl-binding protein [Selenomonadaceae bacterium]